jgi:hypothetical protein
MNRLIIIVFIFALCSCNSNEGANSIGSIPGESGMVKVDTTNRRRFSSQIKFEEYAAVIYRGKYSEINYSSSQTALSFRTSIKWAIDSFGVNFGGHYNLSRWGCGTNCINGVITDLKNGYVYDLPPATIDYEFKNDSRLLVINPPDSSGYFDYCSYCEPELWVWNDEKREFKKVN